MHLNINSVLGLEKRLGLDSILSSNKFDLVVIQESKIGVETPDASLNYPSYQLFRRDRSLGSGGVLLFVKKSYKIIFCFIDPVFETIGHMILKNYYSFKTKYILFNKN